MSIPTSYTAHKYQQLSEESTKEARRAADIYGPMNSPHEAYGVLQIELDEFRDAIHAKDMEAAYAELLQIEAVAKRTRLCWEHAIRSMKR